MPPLPVIHGVYRITLPWTAVSGVAPRNVFHVESASSDVEAVGTALDQAFQSSSAGMFEIMPTGMECLQLEILPLDGVQATVITDLTQVVTGGGGGGQFSPASAAVLSMRTTQRGPQGRGRMYIGPCTESFIADGVIDTQRRDDMVGAWKGFLLTLRIGSPSCTLVVASYTHARANTVLDVSMSTTLGTQRRRQDQLR